jgi:bacterioferritin
MFSDSAKESFKHAQLIGDKIVALGGVPTVERNPVQQSHDLVELLKIGLEFETKAVRLYTALLELTGDDRALTVFLEDILVEEQEGVDELTKVLRDPAMGGMVASLASAVKAG